MIDRPPEDSHNQMYTQLKQIYSLMASKTYLTK